MAILHPHFLARESGALGGQYCLLTIYGGGDRIRHRLLKNSVSLLHLRIRRDIAVDVRKTNCQRDWGFSRYIWACRVLSIVCGN